MGFGRSRRYLLRASDKVCTSKVSKSNEEASHSRICLNSAELLELCVTYKVEHSRPFFSIVSMILMRIGGATSGGENCSVRSGSEKACCSLSASAFDGLGATGRGRGGRGFGVGGDIFFSSYVFYVSSWKIPPLPCGFIKAV